MKPFKNIVISLSLTCFAFLYISCDSEENFSIIDTNLAEGYEKREESEILRDLEVLQQQVQVEIQSANLDKDANVELTLNNPKTHHNALPKGSVENLKITPKLEVSEGFSWFDDNRNDFFWSATSTTIPRHVHPNPNLRKPFYIMNAGIKSVKTTSDITMTFTPGPRKYIPASVDLYYHFTVQRHDDNQWVSVYDQGGRIGEEWNVDSSDDDGGVFIFPAAQDNLIIPNNQRDKWYAITVYAYIGAPGEGFWRYMNHNIYLNKYDPAFPIVTISRRLSNHLLGAYYDNDAKANIHPSKAFNLKYYKWIEKNMGGGHYTYIRKGSPNVLTALNLGNGAAVTTKKYAEGWVSQIWQKVPIDNYYRLGRYQSTYSLDGIINHATDGTRNPSYLWPSDNANGNQHWIITKE